MSMSTRIDDLPGPSSIPENIRGDLSQIQNDIRHEDKYELQQQQPRSNINMNIKKKVHFKDDDEYIDEDEYDNTPSFLSIVKSEINEENLLLLVLLIIICRPELDLYMTMIPMMGSYLSNSSLLLLITKSVLILILFILAKHYILPKIKV